MIMTTKTFAHCRVSSKKKNEDRQVQALLELGIDERNIFIEHCSGKNFDRPNYQTLKSVFRKNDVVLIKSNDSKKFYFHDLCIYK